MINHYRTLGVDPQAETVVIRGAYLALIRRYHPDKGGEEADAARAQAVTAAWDVLRDPDRRAAYDDSRQARFQPNAIGTGTAVFGQEDRVRGGTAGRNLFLLLAAGTLGLGWWALGQPQFAPPVKVAANAGRPAEPVLPGPVIRPVDDERAVRRRFDTAEEQEQPRLPDVRREPEVDTPAVVPPLPVKDPVRTPVRTGEPPAPARRVTAVERVEPQPAAPAKPRTEERTAAVAATVPAAPRIDLAPLERHLQLLTDQSLRFGTEAKRSRLYSSREEFLTRLRGCDSDACKRDAYLRRNAEVSEIMRN